MMGERHTDLWLWQQGLCQQELSLASLAQFKSGHGQTAQIFELTKGEGQEKKLAFNDALRRV